MAPLSASIPELISTQLQSEPRHWPSRQPIAFGQGSIASNENGGYEVYRGSKAALNMFMRSFAARHAAAPRTLLLMAPGWVRTDMGGPQARLSIEGSIPKLVNTMDAQAGKAGLQYLDYLGREIPW